MAKKTRQSKQPTPSYLKDEKVSLKDQLNGSILEQLKQKKQVLETKEEKRKEEELKRQQELRKQQEKNKSFEQLLNESELNWNEFK
ncbi:YqkE family protein [Priestia abyssalis]|uniref:YqkE family protein n=1 Tax=Priestia abyssalis TaxID=1221450 RepID=UPI000995858F|nr:YqkE family protein [Priestia abyssalis]